MSPSSRQLRNYLCIPSLGSSNGTQHTIYGMAVAAASIERKNWMEKKEERICRAPFERPKCYCFFIVISSSRYICSRAPIDSKRLRVCVSVCTMYVCVCVCVFDVIPFYCCRFSSVSIVAAVWPTFAHKSINNHIVCNSSIRESTKRSPVANSIPTRIFPFSLCFMSMYRGIWIFRMEFHHWNGSATIRHVTMRESIAYFGFDVNRGMNNKISIHIEICLRCRQRQPIDIWCGQ